MLVFQVFLGCREGENQSKKERLIDSSDTQGSQSPVPNTKSPRIKFISHYQIIPQITVVWGSRVMVDLPINSIF